MAILFVNHILKLLQKYKIFTNEYNHFFGSLPKFIILNSI